VARPMKIDPRRRLFVGLKLDAAMRSDLAHLAQNLKQFVEDPTYLSLCLFGEDKYLGKIIDGGLPTDSVDDVRRNVVSIMARIFPERRVHGATLKIFCADDVAGVVEAPPPPEDDELVP